MPLASPIAVSTITHSGNVVTVTTSAAHNLVANQGFSLTSVVPTSFNVNCTVASVPSSTTFTFNQTAPATYTSGGSLLPAKECIILSVTVPQAGQFNIRYLLWLTTVSPIAGGTSAWTGASAQENAALTAGTTIEVQRSVTFPSTSTQTEIITSMAADFAAQQAALAGSVQPGTYYGIYFDGTGWS